MITTPALLACLFATFLVVLAILMLFRQSTIARRLVDDESLAADERQYLRSGIRRRVILSVNLLVTAGLLVGTFASGMEARASAFADRPPTPPGEPKPEATEEERAFLRFYGWYWSGVVVSVMSLIALAAWDLFAIRRYELSQLRRLQADRRVMLRDELAELARQRRQMNEGRNGET